MLTRRTVVASGAAAIASLATRRAQAEAALSDLGAMAAKRGILFGTAVSTYQLRDTRFAPVLVSQARILVPEYEMKRALIEPQPGVYRFGTMDELEDFAHAHGIAFRGHPLVWHKRNPDWLDGALTASTRDSR
ncbi:MAG TPA: endo-1,4-beta-xylanase, partial [Rhizomicrobium sp.]